MDTSPLISPKPYKTSRSKLVLWLVIVGVCVFLGLILWIRTMYIENRDAKQVLGAREKVIEEVSTCKNLLTQSQGEFDQYEYCKELVEQFSAYAE